MRSIALMRGSAVAVAGRKARTPAVCREDFGPHRQLAVRGLIFDLGGVLYDATLGRRWLLRLLARMGHTPAYHCFYREWESEYLADVYRGRREYGEAFQAFLLAQGLTWAQIDEVEAAGRCRHPDLEAGERPLPGVASTLEALAERGIRMAVLANSAFSASQILAQLDRLGLSGRFESVISSCDLDAVKPDPACYRAALAELQSPSGEAAFIGHTAADLAGAATVGLHTIAFNHDSNAQADAYLTRFVDLLPLVTVL